MVCNGDIKEAVLPRGGITWSVARHRPPLHHHLNNDRNGQRVSKRRSCSNEEEEEEEKRVELRIQRVSSFLWSCRQRVIPARLWWIDSILFPPSRPSDFCPTLPLQPDFIFPINSRQPATCIYAAVHVRWRPIADCHLDIAFFWLMRQQVKKKRPSIASTTHQDEFLR